MHTYIHTYTYERCVYVCVSIYRSTHLSIHLSTVEKIISIAGIYRSSSFILLEGATHLELPVAVETTAIEGYKFWNGQVVQSSS